MGSGIRENITCGIRNTAQESGIPLAIGVRNPSSTDKESGIQSVKSRIQNRLYWIPWRGARDRLEFEILLGVGFEIKLGLLDS